MIEKIVTIVVLIIGALLTYMAKYIGRVVSISKSPEINVIIIKIIGLLIVLVSVIIAFMKF